MDVLFYLKELLQNHKTISIVGLGTLYIKKNPGKYDEINRSFIPPSHSITFNSRVDETEELSNFIALSENIELTLAEKQINEFVDNIHHQLTYQQEVTLDGLGKFTLVNNEITFSADEENEFGNQFYGLPTLNEIIEPNKEIAETSETDAKSINLTDQLLSENNSTSNSSNIETETKFTGKPFTPNYDYDEEVDGEMNKSLKLFLKVLLVIATIAIILGLAYFFKPEFFDNKIKDNLSDPINTETVITTDTVINKDEQLNSDTNKIENLALAVVSNNKPQLADTNITTYEIIGSAEKTQKRIDLVINTMKKKGIEAKALENVPGKLTKISLGSFTNFNLAKKYKDSLRIKLKNPEIYIQTIKPKK